MFASWPEASVRQPESCRLPTFSHRYLVCIRGPVTPALSQLTLRQRQGAEAETQLSLHTQHCHSLWKSDAGVAA